MLCCFNAANFIVNICEATFDGSTDVPSVYLDIDIVFTMVLVSCPSALYFEYNHSSIHCERCNRPFGVNDEPL